jgi:glycosyltransferase involved in cell wall biosynthesis
MTADLTIAIPAKNEERNLDHCLRAIGSDFARHTVVIDSESKDSTSSIAGRFGAEVIQFNWNRRFPKKRNWYLRNHTPQTTWILFLDADEILTPSVKQEITNSLMGSPHQGYLLSYTNYFLGRRLRGGYPLRKLALFRIGEVEYEYIDEHDWSECDMEVHEHPVVRGSVGLIKNQIEHQDFKGIDSYMNKHNQYAAWEAKRLFHLRRNINSNGDWRRSQRLKYKLIQSPYGGLAFFLGSFFIMGGWRDGSIGFAFSMLKAGYFVQISCRLRELEQQDAAS